MVNVEVMIKALRLAWIPRLLSAEFRNWKTIPDQLFKKCGRLNFLLKCNYDRKSPSQMSAFYSDIHTFINELKLLYNWNQQQDFILYNNKD